MSGASRPNVLLVVADDQRFDTISALGNDHVETPNFDSLVRDGTAFTHHYNVGADQEAVCVPARSMIMSGHSLYQLEGPGGMTTEHPTLPETFGDAGYRTFGTGKWHNGRQAFNRSFDEGADIYFGGMGNHWNLPVSDRHAMGEYPEPRPTRGFSGTGSVWPGRHQYDRYASGTHSSELFAGATIDFLDDHADSADERPFFAYMATTAPHDPRTCPGEYLSMYDHDEIPLPESFQPEHPFDIGWCGRDENLEDHPRDPENVRRHIADYYAMITHLDAQIGRVLDALEEMGERDNTIVAFTADHGLAVGRHGLMGKQNLYDHSVRVPLLLAGPGVPDSERCDTLTCHYDLFPTLCDIAGLETPDAVEGESVVPAFDDPGYSPRDAVFLAYENVQRAVRGDRFKLIEYYVDGDRHTQLFDLEVDPDETMDLSDDDEYESELATLRKRLARAQTEMGDPMARE
ncbi:sulfatase-like hydrolase/transferase [Salinarchaeum laminariae]|uniref:sulfatase-like hydrolase/transferase n=1 Tax=Salinarchaeum laminariae TaxID=869888 RepID=UPI0020BF38D0|nr:sulfatase-like hydrolase/transferase [Salinarchaeum laminariae]